MFTRKLLFLLLALCTLPAAAKGDSVFSLELECAQRTLRCNHANYVAVQFSRFQATALLYLQEKQQHCKDTTRTNARWLDEQALDMADFLSLYHMCFVSESLTDEDRALLRLTFRDASLSSPCFYDVNEERVLQFLNTEEETSLTPFSLDTDWHKANAKVNAELRDSKFDWLPRAYQALRQRLMDGQEDASAH